MSKQYCRYCGLLSEGDCYYCQYKGVMSEDQIKRANTCKYYGYEEARKEFFENLLIHKHNQLAVWLRKHDHEKCSDLGAEISYIEDAMKALEKEATNDPCRIESAD